MLKGENTSLVTHLRILDIIDHIKQDWSKSIMVYVVTELYTADISTLIERMRFVDGHLAIFTPGSG